MWENRISSSYEVIKIWKDDFYFLAGATNSTKHESKAFQNIKPQFFSKATC